MSEAERSIAVKKKIAVTKPMSREESPSEIYTPKRRKSEAAEVSPPPYIPSKKESSTVRSRRSAQENEHSSLVKEDARLLLSSRERGELISRSRRMELFQKMGLDRKEPGGSERDRQVREKDRLPSERDKDGGKTEPRNFRITAHVAPSSRLSDSAKERLAKALEQRDRSLQITVVPRSTSSQKASLASRLGKIVVQRKSTDASKDERSQDQRDKTKVTFLPKSRRLALSILGKDIVKKQCEAAALSVKSSGLRKYVQKEVQDSRVVESHVSSDDEEHEEPVKERTTRSADTAEVGVSKESETVSGDSLDKDSEDLDDMLKDDIDPELDNSLQDEFTLDLDDEDDLIKVVGKLDEEDVLSLPAKDKADRNSGTRFIVTLDGVDERQFEGQREGNFGDSVPPTMGLLKPSLAAHTQQVAPLFLPRPLEQTPFGFPQDPAKLLPEQMLSKPAPPKIQPFSINLKDSDDEFEDKIEMKALSKMAGLHHPVQPVVSESSASLMDASEGLTTLQKAKQMERCKFWPACAAGAECEFHHPTSYCKTFPNCKFGDKCLFIHPNCRFDSKCARPDCPFTHTSRRPAVAAAPFKPPMSLKQPYYPQYIPFSNSSQSTVCKFFPNCQNVNCTFIHPKTCHFGATCQNQACPFYHPTSPTPTPSKDKLKWTAQTQIEQQAHQGKSALTTIPTQSPLSKVSPSALSMPVSGGGGGGGGGGSIAAVSSTSV